MVVTPEQLEARLRALRDEVAQTRDYGAQHGADHTRSGRDPVRLVMQKGAGVPTHKAAEGTLYWDETDNQFYVNNDGAVSWTSVGGAAGGGAPANADYLVGTAHGDLSAEIVVGTTPGGELGNTWASPTVDGTHSGSAHHAESHAPESHTDTDITGAELETLSDGSNADTEHKHSKIDGLPNFTIGATLTISGGTAGPVTDLNHPIDTEGGAGDDELDHLTGGVNGDWVYLSPINNARNIIVKHGVAPSTGRFQLSGLTDVTMTDTTDSMLFRKIAGLWLEWTRSANLIPLGILSGGNWKALYTDGSGDVQELALATAGAVSYSQGAAAAPAFTGAGAKEASTTPSNIQTTWASKSGNARKVIVWDDDNSKPIWGYINAIDIQNPPGITSFSDGLGNTEIASSGTVTPNFTVAYEGSPSAATIDVQAYSSDDPEVNPGDYPITLSDPWTGYVGEPVINKETTAVGATVTWRVAATVDGQALTKDHTLTYLNRKYYGPDTEATALDSAEILALDSTGDGGSALDSDYRGTWTVDADTNEYVWFCYRDALGGTPTFTVGGFPGGFSDKGTVSHTNDSGFTEDYRMWRSDNHSLGSTEVVVT